MHPALDHMIHVLLFGSVESNRHLFVSGLLILLSVNWLQVLRYVEGQKYDAHWDWFDDVRHKP